MSQYLVPVRSRVSAGGNWEEVIILSACRIISVRYCECAG
jgi:hypothetical protein